MRFEIDYNLFWYLHSKKINQDSLKSRIYRAKKEKDINTYLTLSLLRALLKMENINEQG